MKIFLSWSGHRSRAVAEVMSVWIKCVLQATSPWISTRDIDRGALWFTEIGDQLKDTSIGIICLTQENKDQPWILFEAGALARGLSANRVCTFLVDLKTTDVRDPLAQFNHTLPDKESMRQLVRTLNSCLATGALGENVFADVFETYWPQFEAKFADVLLKHKPTESPKRRSDSNILEEILESTRSLSHRLSRLERLSESETTMAQSKESVRSNIRQLIVAGASDDEIIPQIVRRHRFPSSLLKQLIARERSDWEDFNKTNPTGLE